MNAVDPFKINDTAIKKSPAYKISRVYQKQKLKFNEHIHIHVQNNLEPNQFS